MISYVMWIGIWTLVMALGEYLIHRYTMHRKMKILPSWIFQHHSIEHHHHERNDINIDLPFYNHLIIGSPLIIGAFFMGLPCLLALLSVFAFHSYTWTKIHRGIHDLEKNWVMKYLPSYFKWAKHHHELHHHRPGRNFGVVYLFTDYLFGTKIK